MLSVREELTSALPESLPRTGLILERIVVVSAYAGKAFFRALRTDLDVQKAYVVLDAGVSDETLRDVQRVLTKKRLKRLLKPCVSMMGETDLVKKPPPGHERFSHGRDPHHLPKYAG